jgi:hypothetical protein
LKQTYPINLLKFILVVLLALFSALSASASDQQSVHTDPDQKDEVGEQNVAEQEDADKRKSGFHAWVDREKKRADSQGHQAARWVDSFFSDPEYEAEVATSQVRVRPELYYRQEQGLKAKIKLAFRISLPNLNRRVSLVGGSTDFDSSFDEAVDDDISEPAIGLQFFGKEREKWSTNISVGVKGNEFAGFIGPRYRYQTNLTQRTSFRFVQKLLWQTNNEWQARSRFDFNFMINEQYFFRQLVDARWRGEHADEEGWRTRVSSLLTKRLSKASGLQSEVSAVFHTRPDTHVDEYVVALRYRKQTWRDWFYYEIVPQVSWEDEFDYKFNPGIHLRFEIFYGDDESTRYWRREVEDTEDFRW